MELFYFLLMLLSMGLGSFLAGNLPLSFNLSGTMLNLVNTFSAGLLVGTALVVIIPEGIETLYDSQTGTLGLSGLSASLGGGIANGLSATSLGASHAHGHAHSHSSNSHLVALSLSLGFYMMLILDNLNSHPSHADHIEISNFRDSEEERIELGHQEKHPEKAFAASFGLVLHSAADGLAFGAASVGEGSVSAIVFLAIMLHKAPAAFGLTTFLLKQATGRKYLRNTIIAFSLAAPLTALVTYLALGISHTADLQRWTAIVLLFSGGTFLYVSTVHILPEIYAPEMKLSRLQILLLTLGMFFPLLLSSAH